MKYLVFAIAVFLSAVPARAAFPSIVGHWLFFEKIYEKKVMPEPPSATLRLHFDFSASGESSLYWWHEGDTDHCARKGVYHLEDNVLVDEITWVDPANTVGCSDDTDMQLGRKTRTPLSFLGENLVIRFQLDTESLDFVWKKIGENPRSNSFGKL